MSHFTVWILGPDLEKQLAPYDENLEVEPYRDYEEGEDLERMQKHYGTVDLAELAAKMGDWHGSVGGVDERGLYSMSTYNPRSKWDWYTIGGRWLGSLIIKQGAAAGVVGRPGVFDNRPRHSGGVDQARRGDVDFEAMEMAAAIEAADYYARLEAATAGLPTARTWREVRAEHGDDVAAARALYGSQPAVMAIRQAQLDPWDGDAVETLRLGREAYVARSAQHSWVPRVVVRDGRWEEVGSMGWFGMSSDEPEEFDPWAAEVRSVILNLPDDMLISVVDCHI